ncbi:MAG: asparagine synthase (glutamine-hydrolyzing) [Acidobacteriia bacterium]|nr:asparagine synthase (glutamine-hydrolyzing) [Terriglobia bacterium]
MCGICGIVLTANPATAEARVRAMSAALRHRGPDDEGFLAGDSRAAGVALGMRRLSIIDLQGGHQPIWNEAHNVAVVLNGEIYNYRELRERLTRAGHQFSTHSDTEVLVHGWEEWGEDCLHELRGMYAFALLDLRGQVLTPQLFLARDPLGIKPLYYTQTREGLFFASEVRALLAGGVAKELSPDALTSYLLFGSVSEPVTLIENVFSVPPGHSILLLVPDRRQLPRPRPWWDVRRSPAARDPKRPREFAGAVRALRPLLEDAVRAHLIADVPVGLFLSSGLDSSAIAALAAREQRGIRSFTLTFPGTPYDEAPLARSVARHCGTEHTEVPLGGAEMLGHLENALGALDQPTMDGMNTYLVAWAARQVGLKVALSGLGGDELFAGYRTFRDVPRLRGLAQLARLFPAALRHMTAPLAERIAALAAAPDAARKAAALWRDPEPLPDAYFFARALFPPGELERIATPRYRSSAIGGDGTALLPTWLGWMEHVAGDARNLERVAGISWLELRTYMVSTLLRDTDSVSMDRSLEVRVPLLDTPLVEFLATLPDAARRRPGVQKALLVEALRDVLPGEIVTQAKRTFTLPWEEWLRGPLRERIETSLAEPAAALAPHLHLAGVRGVWEAFQAGRTSWSRVWSLYVLNEWCHRNL